MKAIIYSRVSTEEQDFQRQIDELKDVAKKDGFAEENILVYTDKISGFTKTADREGFSLLQQKVESDSISKIYVWELSRLARNQRIILETVEFFNLKKIPIYVYKENITTLEPNGKESPQAALLIALLGTLASQEVKTFKERSLSGRKKSVRDGKASGGVVTAYGFKKNENGMLVIDEEEADVVRKVFSLSLEGLGSRKIANYLNANRIPTKYNKLDERPIKFKTINASESSKNKRWKDAVVYNMLTNPLYKGKRSFSGQITNVTPIVDVDVFDKVQEQLPLRKIHSKKNTKFNYLFREKVRCGVCGKPMLARNRTDGTESYFACSSIREGGCNCGNRGISINGLESAVWSLIVHFGYLDYVNTNKEENITELKRRIEEHKKVITSLEAQKSSINESLERNYNAYLKGLATEELYSKGKVLIDKELKNVDKDVSFYLNEIDSIKAKIELVTNVDFKVSQLETLASDRNKLKEIMDVVLKNVIVYNIEKSFYYLLIVNLVPLTEFGVYQFNSPIICAIYQRNKNFIKILPNEQIGEDDDNPDCFSAGVTFGGELFKVYNEGVAVDSIQRSSFFELKLKNVS